MDGCINRRQCIEEKTSTGNNGDDEAASKKSRPKPLPLPSSCTNTSSSTLAPPITRSTTSENLSHISSPNLSSRVQTPFSSLVFPLARSKYASMRVGRTAWTPAYLPPSPHPHASGLEPPILRPDSRTYTVSQ